MQKPTKIPTTIIDGAVIGYDIMQSETRTANSWQDVKVYGTHDDPSNVAVTSTTGPHLLGDTVDRVGWDELCDVTVVAGPLVTSYGNTVSSWTSLGATQSINHVASASIQIGTLGEYQAFAYDSLDRLLVETHVVIGEPSSGPQLSTTTNTYTVGSTSNKSTATPADGTDYIYMTHENEPRFATHITAGYSGLKWTSDTATLYLKFTTSSSVTQGSLFMSDSNYDGNGPDAPLFEHWWDANAKNMQLMIANSSNTHAVSANIYYDLQLDTTYEWVYHFGSNGYFDVIVNGVQVPVAQQNGSGPYYIQVGVYGTNITSSVQHSTSGTVKDVTFADIVFPRIGYAPGGSAQWTMDAFGMFNQHIVYDDFDSVSTELAFDGFNTLNVANIPATANKFELFRNGVSVGDIRATGVKIGSTGFYQVRAYYDSMLLAETQVVPVDTVASSLLTFDNMDTLTVEVPSGATGVKIFRNGILFSEQGTGVIKVFTTGTYQAKVYATGLLLIETGKVIVNTVKFLPTVALTDGKFVATVSLVGITGYDSVSILSSTNVSLVTVDNTLDVIATQESELPVAYNIRFTKDGVDYDSKLMSFASTPAIQLTHDGFDKLTVSNATYNTTQVQLNSGVYNIGGVSDLYIAEPGTYQSVTVEQDGYTAHIGNVTVAEVKQDTEYSFEQMIQGYATSTSPSQGSMGSYMDFNGDGTRMVVGMGLYNSNAGRAAVYHLEDGSWVRKVDLAPPNAASRFGDSVCMSEDGTRIAVNQYPNNSIYIYDYSGGVWPTSATKTITGNSGDTPGGADMDMNRDGTVIIAGQGESGTKAFIYTRNNSTGDWSETKEWVMSGGNLGNGVALNGAGTRALIGRMNVSGSGYVYEILT
jgi:hypothetical protein